MARIHVIETATRPLETPAFFPVNNAGMRGEGNGPPYWTEIPDMKTMLLNAHLLNNSSVFQTLSKVGLHDHYVHDGVFFLDSGGLQHRVYNKKIDPLEILRIQEKIGADIASTLDVLVLPSDDPLSHTYAEHIQTSVKNALFTLQSREREDMKIYVSLQGNHLKSIINMIDYLAKRGNFDGYAIGGLVPKRSDFRRLINIVHAVRRHIGDAPLHVFGLGGPSYIPLLTYLGVDSFDSSSYLKAGSKRVFFLPAQGSVDFCDIGNQEWLPCICPVCSQHTACQVREQRKLLALHNLWMIAYELRRLKVAIQENQIEGYLEWRFQSNPLIYNAYRYAKAKMRGFV